MILEALGNIGSIATAGLGLFGALKSRSVSKKQESFYKQESELNRQIGSFNAYIAELMGQKEVTSIAQETKSILSQQQAIFARRGISFEGSPMFVMGNTVTMGEQKAQEAYFNSEVKKINYQYQAMGATQTSLNAAERSKYNALSSTLEAAKIAMQIGGIAKSASNLGIATSFNILTSLTK